MTAQSHVKTLFFLYTTQFIPLPLSLSLLFCILILYPSQLTIFMPHAEVKMGEPVVNGEKHYSQFLDVCTPLQPNENDPNISNLASDFLSHHLRLYLLLQGQSLRSQVPRIR